MSKQFSDFGNTLPKETMGSRSERRGTVREIQQSPRPQTTTPRERPPLKFFADPQPSADSPNTALDKSKEILEAAERDAADIVQKAKAQAIAERESARVTGLEEGRQETAQALLELNAARKRALDEARSEIFEIALAVAEEVIAGSVREQPQLINERVARAMAHLINSKNVIIAVNPADAPFVERDIEQLQKRVDGGASISVRNDPAVQRGDARLESEHTVIDASISAHLEAIHNHFLGIQSVSELGGIAHKENDTTPEE